MDTPIIFCEEKNNNKLYIKREDFIPFSFGGNKARKARLFFEEIDKKKCDCVVTYGSSSSNHCRVVSNMAYRRNILCFIISPEESSKSTFNSRMMSLFGAEIKICPVSKVKETIEATLEELQKKGYTPYFIPGGGHGNVGTQAYVDCYQEILDYEKEKGIHFDYIFHASGTGTTQAGLVCGKIINADKREIVGISIARKKPYGRDVVCSSVQEYLQENKVDVTANQIQENVIFVDEYVGEGYGCSNEDVLQTIKHMMCMYGIPLDSTYTGKAFCGMKEYLKKEQIIGKNILFIHTGGTPLFFDNLKEIDC